MFVEMAVPARWDSPAFVGARCAGLWGFPGACRGRGALGCRILRRLSGCDALDCGSSPALVGDAVRWAMRFSCACRGHGALGCGSSPAVARLYYEILRCSSGCGWSDAASFPVEVRRNWRCGFVGACRGTSHLGCGNSLAFAEVRLYRRCDGSGRWLAVVAA